MAAHRLTDMAFVELTSDFDNITVSLTEWGDLCTIFFVSLGVFPPYSCAKKFSADGALKSGMSGELEWKGFLLDKQGYDALFTHFKNKFPKLIFAPGSEHIEFLSKEELSIWRYEVAYGIPAHEHRERLRYVTNKEKKFRQALGSGEEKKAHSAYLELMHAQGELQDFIMSHMQHTQ